MIYGIICLYESFFSATERLINSKPDFEQFSINTFSSNGITLFDFTHENGRRFLLMHNTFSFLSKIVSFV